MILAALNYFSVKEAEKKQMEKAAAAKKAAGSSNDSRYTTPSREQATQTVQEYEESLG